MGKSKMITLDKLKIQHIYSDKSGKTMQDIILKVLRNTTLPNN